MRDAPRRPVVLFGLVVAATVLARCRGKSRGDVAPPASHPRGMQPAPAGGGTEWPVTAGAALHGPLTMTAPARPFVPVVP